MNKELWIKYFERYPLSQIQDFIKYLYQSVLGSAHLIVDENANYQRLLDEYNSIDHDKTHILYEEISDVLVRVHLEALNKEELKDIHRLFMLSAEVSSSKEELLKVFSKVEEGIVEGWIPFDINDWKKEIDEYINKGCPVVSHSEIFRKQYHPHYRLMKKEYLEE